MYRVLVLETNKQTNKRVHVVVPVSTQEKSLGNSPTERMSTVLQMEDSASTAKQWPPDGKSVTSTSVPVKTSRGK